MSSIGSKRIGRNLEDSPWDQALVPKPAGRRFFLLPALTAFLLVVASCGTGASVHYVRTDAAADGDGTSWETAFTHPQDAVEAASPGDQIWVALGNYSPRGPDDHSVLTLAPGVLVFGGFDGTERSLEDRDPAAHVTTLDGLASAYHVVLAVGVEKTVLDGFTITGGSAFTSCFDSSGENPNNGGGVFSAGSSLEIRRCRLTGNTASFKGGGIYLEGSDLVVTDCAFEGNAATFGAGIGSLGSSLTLVNCIFRENGSEASGGAAALFESSSHFVNTIFSGNSAVYTGGGVLANASESTFTNCTFNGNRSERKPGGAVALYEGRAFLRNSILWGDLSADLSEISSTCGEVKVLYSIVQGGYEGTENLDETPRFALEGAWETDGSWADGDYTLSGGSPAIDSGTASGAPDFDIAGVLRPQEGAFDRGAYEFKAE